MKREAVRLSKTYGNGEAAVQALRPCSFTIESGERAAIVGASGSGKTTLLHLLGALETPTDGSVLYDGQPLSGGDEEVSRFRLRRIGFVFQSYQLIPELTALENVLLPRLLRGGKQDKRTIAFLLKRLRIADRANRLPSQLSGGQQQRVAIARALVNRPELLLCAEPTGNLDTENSLLVLQLLEELQEEFGMTLLVVTHNPEIAARFPRVLSITDGIVGGDLR